MGIATHITQKLVADLETSFRVLKLTILNTYINMNLLFSILTICIATIVIGLPQNYGSGREIGQSLTGKKPELPKLSEGCKIQYKTVYDIVEKDVIEKKCTEKYREVFDVKYETVCTPYQEKSVQFRTKISAKQNTEIIAMRPTRKSKNPMLRMSALIKTLQFVTSIGNVLIPMNLLLLVGTKSGLTI